MKIKPFALIGLTLLFFAACTPANVVNLPENAVSYSSDEDVAIVGRALASYEATGDIPPGWRQLSRDEVGDFVSRRAFGITYESNGEQFEYVFLEDSVQRRRRAGGTGPTSPEVGPYRIENDGTLCARWNVVLCYTYFTDGVRVAGVREFSGRYFADVYGPPLKLAPSIGVQQN